MSAWKPIESAPRDGTEVLAWREDCGVMLARYCAPIDFMPEDECERIGDSAEQQDWFYADFRHGGRMQGDEVPTHWMPLPTYPAEDMVCPGCSLNLSTFPPVSFSEHMERAEEMRRNPRVPETEQEKAIRVARGIEAASPGRHFISKHLTSQQNKMIEPARCVCGCFTRDPACPASIHRAPPG